MIISKVTGFADAFGVELAVRVLTLGRIFEPAFAVVAVAAHAGGVVVRVCVRTLRDQVSMLYDHFLRHLCLFGSPLLLLHDRFPLRRLLSLRSLCLITHLIRSFRFVRFSFILINFNAYLVFKAFVTFGV